MTPQMLLEQTQTIVHNAGDIVRDHWKRPRKITKKGRIDLVTETDVAVEKYLKQHMKDLLPDADFLAEESVESKTPSALCWVIDPIDGTTNFAHGLPFVGISIGLWVQDHIELGIVYNPILDECFCATRGNGATLNGEPISVSDRAPLEECVVATGFPYDIASQVDDVVARLHKTLPVCRGIRRNGAASLDFAYVACGRLDGYYEGTLQPWDMAAGWLLVEEAGGKVTSFAPQTPMTLNSKSVLATNGLVHQELADLIHL